MKLHKVESIEDIEIISEEILCWDGCDYIVDYVDICPDTGLHYMANGTEVEAYGRLLYPDSCDYEL